MYIEEITKQYRGKIYKSVLIRESYRDENNKVKHRTIANISKLPEEYIYELRRILGNKKGKNNIGVKDLIIGRNYEYGASYVFRKLAEEVGLDKTIYSHKVQWREDVLAMIIGRILYQGSKLSLVNLYKDTGLWEIAGHRYGSRPDVEKHCYKAMDMLLRRKKAIEKQLGKRHLNNGAVIIYDITNTWFEGEYKYSQKVKYGKNKDNKCGYKQISLGLITTKAGCPVGIEIFEGNVSEQKTVAGQIKKLREKYGIEEAIFVGDRGILTSKQVKELNDEGYKTISALTHVELKKLITEKEIQMELFDEKDIAEIIDSETGERYMLCKNEGEMLKERETRNALIKKVKDLLSRKAKVKRKRNPQKIAASVGRIFEKYRIEKFFEWKVEEKGELIWHIKEDKIAEEEQLDGCYVIKTTATQNNINKEEVVKNYRRLQNIEYAFKNMKTVVLELRPIYHKKDKRIEAHIFIVMLAYYLQWHAVQKLQPLFNSNAIGGDRRWTFNIVIERLKSIRKVEMKIKNITVKYSLTQPDDEQKRILDLLNVKIV